ncbi:MAG: DUF362 domain-containing protein [Deltaproteobacteria bacterium]|nr:DUF362 domain-containing protein [Deltaproteobacteria bacterium]
MVEKQKDVVFADAREDLSRAVGEVFSHFGGAGELLAGRKEAWIKVNAVDLRACCYTAPAVVEAAVRELVAAGAQKVVVAENSTQGTVTRLVARATGLAAASRRAGAEFLCMDETPPSPVFLPGLSAHADVSLPARKALVDRKKDVFYLSIPKLKTHSMTTVTLGLKNQFGFLHHASRVADHNMNLHQKIADLYAVMRPDFTLVDGLFATNHGHFPARANAGECVVETGVVIGGENVLAVDAAAASFLGIEPMEVRHLALAAGEDPGAAAFDVVNRELYEQRAQKFTHHLLMRLPMDLRIIRGKERCCAEGCELNTLNAAELMHCDHGGRGGFTIIMGKGADPDEVARVQGPVHLAGTCAAEQWRDELSRRLGRRMVTASVGCNNLPDTIQALCRHMKVSPTSLAVVNPLRAVAALASARLHGSRARVPRLF